MTIDVDIPKVIEGAPACRIFHYAHTADAASLPLVDPMEVNARSFAGGAASFLSADALGNLQVILAAQSGQGEGYAGVPLETDGESDILHVDWLKDTGQPVGVLHVQLAPRHDYASQIQAGDLLFVWMRGTAADGYRFVTVVSVDTVTPDTSLSDTGATVHTVSVQARDMGKVLMGTRTVYDAAFGGQVIARFFQEFLQAFSNSLLVGGPSLVVQQMLAVFFSLRQNFVTLALGKDLSAQGAADAADAVGFGPLKLWQFPGHPTATLFSLIDLVSFSQTPMVGALVADATLLQSAGNLWQLCEMYANGLVNEFFVDVRDYVPGYDASHRRAADIAGKFLERIGSADGVDEAALAAQLDSSTTPQGFFAEVNAVREGDLAIAAARARGIGTGRDTAGVALVHRQLPYDTYSFYLLPTSVVFETEVTGSVALSRSSADVVNYFRVRMPGFVEGVQQDVQFGVTINRASIARHGLLPHDAQTVYPMPGRLDREQFDRGGGLHAYTRAFDFYMQLLTTWYAWNERLLAGTMQIGLRPDIRAGTRITYVRTKDGVPNVVDAYVQQVQHTFSPEPGGSSTSLQVIRGIERSSTPTPEAGLFWDENGRALLFDPYEVVVSEDIVSKTPSAGHAPAAGTS